MPAGEVPAIRWAVFKPAAPHLGRHYDAIHTVILEKELTDSTGAEVKEQLKWLPRILSKNKSSFYT
jgi:hypothetical protein